MLISSGLAAITGLLWLNDMGFSWWDNQEIESTLSRVGSLFGWKNDFDFRGKERWVEFDVSLQIDRIIFILMSLNDFSVVVPDPLLSIEVLDLETTNNFSLAALMVKLLENHTFDFMKFASWKSSGEPVVVGVVVFTIEET